MTEFTPVASLLGGMLIGLSAVILMGANGRIAGISGIIIRLFPTRPYSGMRGAAAFILGLMLAAPIYAFVAGDFPQQMVSSSLYWMVGAGLLVGFGAGWGSGCTSGHGVCGISRLSGRSIVATMTFMATAFLTVLLLRHGGVL